MSDMSILERITADGLTLSVSDDGSIEILGDENKVDSWLETIRENKVAILAELEPLQDLHPCKVFTPGNATCNVSVTPEVTQPLTNRARTVNANALPTQSDSKYSVTVTDASTDPVRITVSINGLGSVDLEIDRARYDGMAILELMELHSMERKAA